MVRLKKEMKGRSKVMFKDETDEEGLVKQEMLALKVRQPPATTADARPSEGELLQQCKL